MAEPYLNQNVTPGLHLISAFVAMENTNSVISLARECGGGLVTERVQRFFWENCISQTTEKGNVPYLKNLVKKLISEIESSNGIPVVDELYEKYGYYMSSLKDDISGQVNARICKCISFLFPELDSPTCPNSRKLVVPLSCSRDMLEGDTGCSVWPSSLYLSEFILSFPHIFSNKTCFEVGSGVGLVGICLSHVKASKVILSDGDLSTLANMKLNLEANHLTAGTGTPEKNAIDLNTVKCIHLPWESATRDELQERMPDIVLGADIIYDPSCLPHLVEVLSILLNQMEPHSCTLKYKCQDSLPSPKSVNGSTGVKVSDHLDDSNGKKGPCAYIASVIRNIDTFNFFLRLAEQANFTITEITETQKPLDLLPYMRSYDRSSIHLFRITSS